MQIYRVSQTDVKLGEPLPYSVYDQRGNLLLKAGFVIKLQRHLDHLIADGLYVRESADHRATLPPPPIRSEAYNTFEVLDLAKLRLQRLFEHYRLGKAVDEFVARIDDLSLTVQEVCSHDTDAALANVHLDYETPYAAVHHLQAAILCELIGKKIGVEEEIRQVLVKAALTYDMGLIDIQEALDRQNSPLRSEQRGRIAAHPGDGAGILERLGVRDPIWLDAVRHHHERLDGSGYPDGLAGDRIRTPTRILAVADIYSAMVRDRPYRKAMVSREAMRKLLLDQGNKTDHRLIEMMIKEIGVFPPGAVVKLASGEIGVVKQRQENSAHPIVYAFLRADGMPMLSPLRRDTLRPEHHVAGMVPFAAYKGCIALIRSLWVHD